MLIILKHEPKAPNRPTHMVKTAKLDHKLVKFGTIFAKIVNKSVNFARKTQKYGQDLTNTVKFLYLCSENGQENWSSMEANKIKNLCKLGESSKVQFKLRLENPAKTAPELVAFANSRGGVMLIGIEDKTGQIVGLTYQQAQQTSTLIGQVANEWVSPTIYLETETVEVDGKLVLVVHVDEGINKPYKDKSGNIWIKQSSDKRRITENGEILSLFQESGSFHPDEKGVRRTSINDIDTQQLNEYLEKYYGKRADEFGMPAERLLQNLQVMTASGQVTLAGLMFFGKHPELFEPAFIVKAVSFFGNHMGGLEYRDSKDITGTIPRMFEQGMSFLKANLHSLQAGQSFNSVGKLEISEVALREVLQNALVHRDYLMQAPIRIMIFDNRVEIISPGGLPRGVNVDSIRFGKTCQRNSLMASFCAKTMDYRGLGTGIMRAIKEEQENIAFLNEDGSQFRVVIDRPSSSYEPLSEYGNAMGTDMAAEDPYNEADDGYATGVGVPDLHRLCPTLPRSEEANARQLLAFCRLPQGMLEMMESVGYKSRTSFRRRLLLPLMEGGLLEPEYKQRPNTPKQRYRSTIY